jgi:hypothetical protein
VCLQAIAIAGVEIDSSACAYVACVHPVRTGFRKVQIDTLFALLVVVYCILIFRGWNFSFAQLMNRLARRPHLSEGEWDFFFFFSTIDEATGDVLPHLSRMGIFFFCTIDEARF